MKKSNDRLICYISIILIMLLPLLFACAGMGNGLLTSPDLSITGVSVEHLSLDKQDIRLNLRISNPNPVPIPVRGLTYELDINSVKFASGFNKTNIDIPASGDSDVALVISGNLINFFLQNRMISKNSVPYSLTGDIALLSSSIRFPYSHQGIIELPASLRSLIN